MSDANLEEVGRLWWRVGRLWWRDDRFGSGSGEGSLLLAEFRASLADSIYTRFTAKRPAPSLPDMGKFKLMAKDLAGLVVQIGIVAAVESVVEMMSREVSVTQERARGCLEDSRRRREDLSLDARAVYSPGEDRLPGLRWVTDLSGVRTSVVRIRGGVDGDHHRG